MKSAREMAAIVDDLRAVYAAAQRVIVPTWLELDLSMVQFKAMVAVTNSPGLGVSQLAEQLSIGQPAASQLVEQLVKRGYVQRDADPEDRRRVRLVASEEGEMRLRELREGGREVLGQWLAELDCDELDALARGARALAQAACGERTENHES